MKLNHLASYVAPLIIAATGCESAYPEAGRQEEAAASAHAPEHGFLAPAPHPETVEKTLCDTANDVWAQLSKQLSCTEMNPKALKLTTLKETYNFLNRLKALFNGSIITPVEGETVSSSFADAHMLNIDEKNGRHHRFEIYVDQTSGIIHLYIGATGSQEKGFHGNEFYNLAIDAHSFSMTHMTNGMGYTDTTDPSFTFNKDETCGFNGTVSIYGSPSPSVSVSSTFSSAAHDSSEADQITCDETGLVIFGSPTDAGILAHCAAEKSEGYAYCATDDQGEKHEHIREQAPLSADESQAAVDEIFTALQSILDTQGIKISPFQK